MTAAASALPPGCSLRPATQADLWPIRRLVFGARLDPTQIRWSQFWVIEAAGTVVACGQLREFADAQELGSLVITPQWRNQGLGSYLVRHLIGQATQPLYLECLGSRLEEFYQRFGFEPVTWEQLPRSLQRKFGLSSTLAKIFHLPLKIMHFNSVKLLTTGTDFS